MGMTGSNSPRHSPALVCAIEAFGGVGRMARALGMTPAAVSKWSRIPVHHAHRISEETGIPLHVLRPDVWRRATARGGAEIAA
jgi:DNA-binding transcriptional regulator YdaS (Cro superfamily)